MNDEDFMRLALEEARDAAEHGDVPVGAVIVDAGGSVLGRGHNRREIDADPTGHAEILALRDAASRLGHWRIEATLFVTLEPCLMCAGALLNARVRRVVFGALDPKAGALLSLFQVGQDARLNHRYEVEGGVLAAESVDALQTFFRRLRSEGQK
jgi:tRNA(adenine34) deaminase